MCRSNRIMTCMQNISSKILCEKSIRTKTEVKMPKHPQEFRSNGQKISARKKEKGKTYQS